MTLFYKNAKTNKLQCEEIKPEYTYEEILKLQLELEKYSGTNYEIHKTIEELTELSLELQQHINKGKDNRQEILEEYVDTIMKLTWIPKAFLFTDNEIQDMIKKKIRKINKYLKDNK